MPDGFSNASKPAIMIVEDEAPLAIMLRYNLEKQGFRVDEAADGQEALTRIAQAKPDLVLLDWMLPTLSGIEVCRQLRRRPATRELPVIMVTARTEDQDAVRALNTGADDYLTKPFSVGELLARIRAILRRSDRNATSVERDILHIGTIKLDIGSRSIWRDDSEIQLSQKEFDLLACLMRNRGLALSRDVLLERVWGFDYVGDGRTVDVHIRRLRIALNGPNQADLIRTVRAAGYALDAQG